MSVLENRRIFEVVVVGKPSIRVMAEDPKTAMDLVLKWWNTPDEDEERYDRMNYEEYSVKSVIQVESVYVAS